MKCCWLFVFFAFFYVATAKAQEVTNNNVEQALEDLSNADEAETEDDSYLQQLSQLRRNPININTATLSDLQVFRFVNELLLLQLLQYRRLLGSFLSIYELQAVPGWDADVINRILPYIKVAPVTSAINEAANRLKGGDHSVLMRVAGVLETARGYKEKDTTGALKYPGSAQRLFFRYKYVYKNLLQYGIVAEKDPGEQFFKGNQKNGFDFYSMHLFARNLGVIKRLALGDFTVNMGQGLLTYQSLAFRKSVDVMNIKRQTEIFRPYNSAGEYNFHRGAAITVGGLKWSLSLFASAKKISSNAVTDSTFAEDYISSVLTSGLHRTKAEQFDRNNTRQLAAGGAFQVKMGNLQLGVNGVHYQLEKALNRSQEPYNAFAFNGKEITNFSTDYGYTYKNLHLFGEVASDKKGSMAHVHGLMASIDKNVDISILYRNIARDYHSLNANAFTENTTPINEKGLFMGISLRPWRFLKVDAYADAYQFPWIKFRVDRPSQGMEYLAQLTWKPNKIVEMYTRFRTETKALNYSLPNTAANQTEDISRQNWRTHVSYKVSNSITLRARAEASWYDRKGPEKEQGFMIYTDFFYKPLMNPLALNARLQFFETDGYNSRIYAYENDVLYSYSIPPLYGKGFRWYANANYDITRKITVWFRIARSFFPDQSTVGSGLDEIASNHRTDYRVQVRIGL